MLTNSKQRPVQTRPYAGREWKTLAVVLPGEEVLQRTGLVLLLTDDAVSLLLLHLPNARREGVDVVEHGLHGDGDFVRLLTRGGEKNVFLICRTESRIQRVVNLPAFVKPFPVIM